jgi:hypothetical protein
MISAQEIVRIPELAKALCVSEGLIHHKISKGELTEEDGLIRYGPRMTRFHLPTALERFKSGKFGTGWSQPKGA